MPAIEATSLEIATSELLSAPLVRDRRVRRVLELIESESTHNVRELALKAHLSAAHLQRLFKRDTGLYIGLFLVEHRIQRAAHLLTDSNLQIKEIAYAVGYEHPSSFVRAFRRHFACSPKQYRLRKDADHKKLSEITLG
jgi:AraC-like DNA-binding protein